MRVINVNNISYQHSQNKNNPNFRAKIKAPKGFWDDLYYWGDNDRRIINVLQRIYKERPSDTLIFKKNKQGKGHDVSTVYSATLKSGEEILSGDYRHWYSFAEAVADKFAPQCDSLSEMIKKIKA